MATTPEPEALRALREAIGKMNETIAKVSSAYETPDEPRDVRMASELTATLVAGGAEIRQPEPFSPEYAMAQLIGIPTVEAARQINLQWLSAVTEMIQLNQERDPRFGTPDDWNVVCSAHLFEHWTKIENVEIIHHNLLPPWSVFLVRSAAWWHRQVANDPLRFNELYSASRRATIIPFPRTQEGPSDG